jgi:hypothetical protein
MKKLIALVLVTLAVSAQAQHHHNHHRHGGNWIAPVIVGGVIGYALTRNYNEPVYNYGYVPPPVIVQPPLRSICTPWTETQYADGTVTRTRTCSQ